MFKIKIQSLKRLKNGRSLEHKNSENQKAPGVFLIWHRKKKGFHLLHQREAQVMTHHKNEETLSGFVG